MSLKGTKTAKNLLASFAGESQANMRYTYYASQAKKDGYVQIQMIFEETARNEKEHAKRFYKFLRDDLEGEMIEIEAAYPVNFADTASNLQAAVNGENEEHTELYPKFVDIAEEEGFKEIAHVFREIAEVEERHEIRFQKLLDNIKAGRVFEREETVEWKCNNCGYIHKGKSAPNLCPACAHPQDHFEIFKETY
ncbi:rubrerythrin [Microaceticoccus formicicus]|uniref:rubrerythrin n=1 Tax=Microaceticoccus formicicus TaxID=3118105 RepID=UPI003CD04B72|nr:rubrerythrin family protein [Peptoniphilaceae bacterium AMB_02]